MNRLRRRQWCGLFIAISSAISLGCGGGGGWPDPTTTIAATKHPLVAQYTVLSPHPRATAWIEFGQDTNYGRQTSVVGPTTGYSGTLSTLVAGMKSSTTYHMRAHVDWPGGSWIEPDRTFTTGPLPKVSVGTNTPLSLPTVTVSHPTPGISPASGVELFNLIQPSGNWLREFITDLEGNVIWYYDPGSSTESAAPFKPLQNGHFILNLGPLLEVDLAGNTVRAVSYGQINQSLQANGYSFSIIGFHHDLLPLQNGHWIALCNTTKDFTNLPGFPGVTHVLGDALVDIDPSGNVVWAWNAFDHLDVNRHPLGLADFEGAGADWTHGNAIVSSADGNLFLSMRNQSWILKIDYQNGMGTGDILWRLGYQGDFALSQDIFSDWFYAQHFPDPLSDDGTQTTFAIWDNGNGRIDADDLPCGISPCYSRATIFQIDQSTKVANLVWQDLPGFFSLWGGSIGLLGNGDMEFDQTIPFGTAASRVQEVTHTDNPQTVWQLDLVGENAYRGYRIPSLYPGVTWK